MNIKLPETKCCKFVKTFLMWLWKFTFAQKQLFIWLFMAVLIAYMICVLWGYYIARVWEFNPLYFPDLPQKQTLLTISVALFAALVVIYALIMQHARSNRLDCTIREVDMTGLDTIWLNADEIEARQAESNESWKQSQIEKIESQAANRILVASTERVRLFIETQLSPFLSKFSDEEFEILRFLLRLIERRGNCPSVATKYQSDYDIRQFQFGNGRKELPVTSDGKTSYWILSQYTLLDHSIRTAMFMIEEIKQKTNSYSIFIPKGILIALAHDIGKIEKQRAATTNLDDKQKKKNSKDNDVVIDELDHPYLSAMIIKEQFPSYSDIDEFAQIVQEHHLPIDNKSASIYSTALKAADQKARRLEIKEWFVKTYGSDNNSPDPYSTMIMEEIDQCDTNLPEQEPIKTNDDAQASGQMAALTSQQPKLPLPKPFSPDPVSIQLPKSNKKGGGNGVQQTGDYTPIPFDLENYEQALLERITNLPTTISYKKGGLIKQLTISVIPHEQTLLVSFGAILGIFGAVIPQLPNQNTLIGYVTFAVNEWRKKKIITNLGTGYSTKQYEYESNMGDNNVCRSIISMIPFQLKTLGLNTNDLLEQAKQHPLFDEIHNLKIKTDN